jgi:excinuclease ABC subunit C
MEIIDDLKEVAHSAPLEPGVYLWKDEFGRVIYVGKAKVLRYRLCSYFSGKKDSKTTALIKRASAIEIILTANEYEALILENMLIKQHAPKYNISLKDGKSYPVIRITEEKYPRVFKTRRIVEDGSRYFGPYTNVQAVDGLMELIEKTFPLRKCQTMHKRESPCMYFHMNRCLAPCCGKVTLDDYHTLLKQVEKIVSGDTESIIIELTESMHREAGVFNFEKAAELRNAIHSIEELAVITSNIVDTSGERRDYIAIASEGVLTSIVFFSLCGGKVVDRDLFRSQSAASDEETLITFITSYYGEKHPLPEEIFVENIVDKEQRMDNSKYAAVAVEDENFIGSCLKEWFSKTFERAPEILVPNTQQHMARMAMAQMNANEDLRKRIKERGAGPALDELQHKLGLQRRPKNIEGFDIAQLDGKHPVASLVTFKEGVPDKSNYRIFKLRTVIGIVDDFAAMREVVKRRYSRLLQEKRDPPDLVLVDGGIGQVNAAKAVLDKLGLDIDVVGLAKRDEELWLPAAETPIKLSRYSEGLKVLQFIRDETHRFATSFNQKLRSEDICFAALESIDSIGVKTAAVIMKTYASLERIAEATPENIAERCSILIEQARAVKAVAQLALSDMVAASERFSQGKGRSAPRAAPKSSGKTKTSKSPRKKAAAKKPPKRAPSIQAGGEEPPSGVTGADLAAEAMSDYGE